MKSIEIELALQPNYLVYSNKFNLLLKTRVEEMFNEISNLKLEWGVDDIRIPVSFEIIENQDYVHKRFPKNLLCNRICKIVSQIELEAFLEKRIEEWKCACTKEMAEYSELDWLKQVRHDLAGEIIKHIYDFAVITNIAYPGLFGIFKGEIIIENCEREEINSISNGLICAYEEMIETDWPKCTKISIQQAWDWVERKTSYLDMVGKTAVDRALNAFSYSFNANNYEELFYSLLGVEALYNTSEKEGIMDQIKTKTIQVLGEPEGFKKRINSMYQIRSAFVHGKKAIPSKFHIHDAQDEFENFFDDYSKTVQMAQSILIATIQKMIQADASEIVTKMEVTLV